MKYNVQIVHISGKHNEAADVLSRYPAEAMQETILELETEAFVKMNTKKYEEIHRWNYLRKSQEEDRTIKMLREKIFEKWKRKESSREIVRYYHMRQYLSLVQGCLMFQHRIIIPEKEKDRVLKEIHSSHQGIPRCISRAKESVWWFGITEYIKKYIGSCIQCKIYENQKVETLEIIQLPKGPWETVGSDIFLLKGIKYILVVDYYSKYIEIAILDKGKNARRIIEKLKSISLRYGIPNTLISDNGPKYNLNCYICYCKYSLSPGFIN